MENTSNMPVMSGTGIKKEELLTKGVEFFSQRGYNGAGLNEILKSADIPKGSFYYYFNSKEDYAVEVIKFYNNQFVQVVKSLLSPENGTALERFKIFYQEMINYHSLKNFSEGCLVGSLSTELGNSSQICSDVLSKSFNAIEDEFTLNIKRGQVDGSIRNDVDAKKLAAFIINSWEGAMARMKVTKQKKILVDCVELITEYLLPV